ncbi:glycosyltransferase [Clostridium sp. YIM B02555]|uniref:glycosyltransferase n=1 Tax=Clostridium sp. YIM B02555 TaxID=2911968 RepID=UPI001EED3334|nr:glycosyltransferase [Clostridium sp. YIM B02555]
MKQNIAISVVMPVYNAEKYLKESIESILNQTYENFEFIIVNDGSTDDSLNIIKRYSDMDDRIVIIDRENKGLVYTLNEGIDLAKGKYIARMDADDISLPDRFMKEFEFLEKNSEYSMVSTFITAFGNGYSDKEMRNFEIIHNKEDFEFIDLLCGGFVLCHPTVMIRRVLFQKYGKYDESYLYCEDLELWLRFMKNGVKIKNLSERLLMYRKNDDSKTYKTRDVFLTDIIRMKLETIIELNKMKEQSNVSYYIWGAGNGGRLCLEECEHLLLNGKCLGYIDMYKKGEFNNKKIYSPTKLKNTNFDYIFVASQPGNFYATVYLSSLGKKVVRDFVNLF